MKLSAEQLVNPLNRTADARVFRMEWNDTNTKIARAMETLGNGLADLLRGDGSEDDMWMFVYRFENATVDLGLDK